jgi:hypothetical protein
MSDNLKYAIAAMVAFILLIVGYIVYSQIAISNAQAKSDRDLALQRDQIRAMQAMQKLSKNEHFDSNLPGSTITDDFVSNLPEGYNDNIQFA